MAAPGGKESVAHGNRPPDVVILGFRLAPAPAGLALANGCGSRNCFLARGEGGLKQDSVAICFQMRALDTTRLMKRLGKLHPASMDNLADAALDALGVVVES